MMRSLYFLFFSGLFAIVLRLCVLYFVCVELFYESTLALLGLHFCSLVWQFSEWLESLDGSIVFGFIVIGFVVRGFCTMLCFVIVRFLWSACFAYDLECFFYDLYLSYYETFVICARGFCGFGWISGKVVC